jgi:heptaprenyl diphosphate synthase
MNRRYTQIALMAAAASLLFTFENLIATPFPWLRLGLANVVTLLALKWWGLNVSLLILIIRILLGSLISGRIMSPVFVLSLTGGLASTLIMAALMNWAKRWFSMLGISVAGAVVHNLTQLVTAYLLYVRNDALFSLVAFFLMTGMAAGSLIGVAALLLDRKLGPLISGSAAPSLT